MLARVRARLSYANVVATLALFVALGGTGYAASQITSKDVKNRSLKGGDLKKDTGTGAEIRDARLGGVPSAQNATTADVSKSAGTATTAGSAGSAATATLADTAKDAQSLAGQGAGAFERATRTQFGKAPVGPAGESGEQVVLSWPELGAQVTSATNQAACPGGGLRVAVKNTKASGASVRVFQADTGTGSGNEPVVAPAAKSYVCTESEDESLHSALTDSSGRTLFVDCLTADGELRCIGTRSEP